MVNKSELVNYLLSFLKILKVENAEYKIQLSSESALIKRAHVSDYYIRESKISSP